MPTSAVTSPVLAGGISTAVAAINGTYKGVRSRCGPPVMWTTVVISPTSNSACPYRKVRPGERLRKWVYQYDALVTTTVATSTNDVTSRSSGAATANLSAAAREIATATHSRPTYTDRSRRRRVGIPDPREPSPNQPIDAAPPRTES